MALHDEVKQPPKGARIRQRVTRLGPQRFQCECVVISAKGVVLTEDIVDINADLAFAAYTSLARQIPTLRAEAISKVRIVSDVPYIAQELAELSKAPSQAQVGRMARVTFEKFYAARIDAIA
ncbi:hypothetical protein FLK61_35395 [Paenalkalicoccus suaedae]|uniref:Uncharacterized protein n=1 Tax=Paenalkalicoccus suaedae TaxID=2592382 RepID=A0A859FH29_9BACI|nr:hypothetical protein [Paenalkalicoccus suaedae]QKS71954.1 hypothetical protein FLK61_35395 [Paenalkalicoccus suaedae]